jgi:hypothetical protein
MNKLISAAALAAMLAATQFAAIAPVQAAPVIHTEKGDFTVKKGKTLPSSAKRTVIGKNDYRRYGLKTPPRGYQWVRVGSEFLMVAITTGVIFSILGAIASH